MAIPFNLPSDQGTEDNYLGLDRFLLDLYERIRLILIRTGRSRGTEANTQSEGDTETVNPTTEVAGNGSGAVVTRAPRRVGLWRRHRPQVPPPPPKLTSTAPVPPPLHPSALFIGVEITFIADRYTSNSHQDGLRVRETKKKRLEARSRAFISLLVPASLSGPVWTTVIFLLGWRLLVSRR